MHTCSMDCLWRLGEVTHSWGGTKGSYFINDCLNGKYTNTPQIFRKIVQEEGTCTTGMVWIVWEEGYGIHGMDCLGGWVPHAWHGLLGKGGFCRCGMNCLGRWVPPAVYVLRGMDCLGEEG